MTQKVYPHTLNLSRIYRLFTKQSGRARRVGPTAIAMLPVLQNGVDKNELYFGILVFPSYSLSKYNWRHHVSFVYEYIHSYYLR